VSAGMGPVSTGSAVLCYNVSSAVHPPAQVEGLASRFENFFEKEKAGSGPGGPQGRFSSPDLCSTTSRPTSTGSKGSLHTPDPGEAGGERKRTGSPLPSPGAAKQRREVRGPDRPCLTVSNQSTLLCR
jgi:hypothetical protein